MKEKLKHIKQNVPYRKPVKQLQCHVCGVKATHVVILELRENPGPPLKENNVLRVICEEHINTNFDAWVPLLHYKALCAEWKKVGVVLNKAYCTISILPLNIK